jgi:ribosomal protein RSM22 (predicted rRNA methylase)
MRRALMAAVGRRLVWRHDVLGACVARSGTAAGARGASSSTSNDALSAVVEDRSLRALFHEDDDDTPPVLPAALRAPDDLVSLLSARDGDAFLDGVHRLSTRSEGIVELPESLQNAVRIAVRDTGATHRQVKAKGRNLLDSLKAVSRGVISLDGNDGGDGDGDNSSVKSWLKKKREDDEDDPLGFGGRDGKVGPQKADRMRDVEWGVALSQKKHKAVMEGLAQNAAARASLAKGKDKEKEKNTPRKERPGAATYGPLEAAAYAVARLPMTYGAQRRALLELRDRCPEFVPKTLLDFGAGPAPSLWAARDVFKQSFGVGGFSSGERVSSATLVDASPDMMTFARRVAKAASDEVDLHELGQGMKFLSKPTGRPLPEPHPWGESGAVKTVASLRSLHSKASFDLVVAAYSLGELVTNFGSPGLAPPGDIAAASGGQRRMDDTVTSLWQRVAPGGALVIVEPGTPNGSRLVRRARARVLETERVAAARRKRVFAGDAEDTLAVTETSVAVTETSSVDSEDMHAHVVAPCQHDQTCPMDGLPTWCHFSQRVKRSEMHRQMLPRGKGAQHQDERFSYVVLRKLSRLRGKRENNERAVRIASKEFFVDDTDEEEDEDEEAEMDAEEIAERRAIEKNMRFSRDVDDVVATMSREDNVLVELDDDEDDDAEAEVEDDDEQTEAYDNPLANAVALASAHRWGRMVRPPIKRSGHVIVDLCDARGALSRQIIAKSNAWEGGVGKGGYKAARKSRWGDLWAYDDPRRLTETKTMEKAGELEEFFSDFADLDAETLASLAASEDGGGRGNPVGVGGAKKPFTRKTKRPEVVEQFVAMEKEHGIDTLAEMMDEQDGEEDKEK